MKRSIYAVISLMMAMVVGFTACGDDESGLPPVGMMTKASLPNRLPISRRTLSSSAKRKY